MLDRQKRRNVPFFPRIFKRAVPSIAPGVPAQKTSNSPPSPFPLYLAVFLSLFINCGSPNEVDSLYYVLLPALKGGAERPTTPTNLTGSYLTAIRQIQLSWDASIDPDLGFPIGVYRIYLYAGGPPVEFYRVQDLFAESPVTSYVIDADPFTGNLYFLVTAFDGLAESYPSNILTINVLTP